MFKILLALMLIVTISGCKYQSLNDTVAEQIAKNYATPTLYLAPGTKLMIAPDTTATVYGVDACPTNTYFDASSKTGCIKLNGQPSVTVMAKSAAGEVTTLTLAIIQDNQRYSLMSYDGFFVRRAM